MTTKTAANVAAFLSQVAIATEKMGLGANLGRIVGFLMICDPACQTAEEIAAATNVDPAEATGTLEGLAKWGSLDRIAMIEDEPACFALRPVRELMAERMQFIEDMKDALAEGIKLLGAEENPLLVEFHDLYQVLQEQLPDALKRTVAQQPS